MLRIYHIQKFYNCSKRTAFRYQQAIRDALQVQKLTIVDFCNYEDITIEQFFAIMRGI